MNNSLRLRLFLKSENQIAFASAKVYLVPLLPASPSRRRRAVLMIAATSLLCPPNLDETIGINFKLIRQKSKGERGRERENYSSIAVFFYGYLDNLVSGQQLYISTSSVPRHNLSRDAPGGRGGVPRIAAARAAAQPPIRAARPRRDPPRPRARVPLRRCPPIRSRQSPGEDPESDIYRPGYPSVCVLGFGF